MRSAPSFVSHWADEEGGPKTRAGSSIRLEHGITASESLGALLCKWVVTRFSENPIEDNLQALARNTQTINYYNVLRPVEEMYKLPYLGNAAGTTPITNVWK